MWSPVESMCAEEGGGANGTRAAPCARAKHSATLVGSHVYIFGGRGAGGSVPLRDFWRYHLGTGEWEKLSSAGEAPPALQEHSATAHGARLYVFGGEPGALSGETPLWIYDTDTSIWRKLASPAGAAPRRRAARGRTPPAAPRGRRGHSAHALNDCLLIYGGYKDLRGSTNELWAFHYETEVWAAVRGGGGAPARHRHAAALHGARLYVHGGQQDLRDCGDLWHYDTISHMWTQVRTPAKLSPSARSGHAGLRAGAHFYIFGGEADGHPTNELWRFHFATETWERMEQGLQWPSPRVDCAALLVAGPPARARRLPAPAARAEPPAGLMREISRLSSFRLRRAARCSYSMLGERDSTESLPRAAQPLAKSHSSYAFERRQPRPGDEAPREPAEPETQREPPAAPDFADVAPTDNRLVFFDSEEEDEARRGPARKADRARLPKSASVRFTRDSVTVTTEDEGELSTSDYASAERVNRVSGFSNPHYLGPDVRALGAALTPDSGAGDMELRELRPAAPAPAQLHVLVLGGREPLHPALLARPLSMWTYRLL